MIDSSHRLQAMVIGNPTDGFIANTIGLLDDYGVDFIVCRDVYSAVSQLARNTNNGNCLIVGRVEQLSLEQVRFFQKASEAGLFCCCLRDGDSPRARKQVLAAEKAGAFVISQSQEIEAVIRKVLSSGSALPLAAREKSTFINDEFLATRAELDVLLNEDTSDENETL